MPVTLRGVAIHCEGELTPDFVGRLIGEAVKTIQAVAVAPVAVAAIEDAPPVKRITRRPRRKPVPTYEKPIDEPNGFDTPEPPKASKVIGIERGRRNDTFNKPPKDDAIPGVGVLAGRIMKLLDSGTGVAAIDHVASTLKCSPFGVKLAVGKCKQLKSMGDGRVALAGYEDD